MQGWYGATGARPDEASEQAGCGSGARARRAGSGRLAGVSRRFLTLSAIGAALTANGLRPLPGGNPLAIPSFFLGWLTSELAPHNLAVTTVGSAAHLARRDRPLDR